MTPDDRAAADAPVSPAEHDGHGDTHDGASDERPVRSSRAGRPSTSRRRQLPLWQETLLLLGIALVLAVLIKAFFLQAFYIPSESMEPGLRVNDRILVEKPSYWGDDAPQRGDVVVFKDPGGWLNAAESAGPEGLLANALATVGLYPTGGHLVKRVIGVEGDVIRCCDKQGRLRVNGEPLEEDSYVPRNSAGCRGPMVTQCRDDWTAGPVPEGHVFVMGDNRAHSADSSAHLEQVVGQAAYVPGEEFVPVDLVVGRVFVVLWPADHFRWVQRPETFEDVPADPQR